MRLQKFLSAIRPYCPGRTVRTGARGEIMQTMIGYGLAALLLGALSAGLFFNNLPIAIGLTIVASGILLVDGVYALARAEKALTQAKRTLGKWWGMETTLDIFVDEAHETAMRMELEDEFITVLYQRSAAETNYGLALGEIDKLKGMLGDKICRIKEVEMPHDCKGRKIEFGDWIKAPPYNYGERMVKTKVEYEPGKFSEQTKALPVVGRVVQMREGQSCSGDFIFTSLDGVKRDSFGADEAEIVLKADGLEPTAQAK